MTRKTKIAALIVGIAALITASITFARFQNKLSSGSDQIADAKIAAQRRVPVVLTPVAMRDFEEDLVVQGNLEARSLAMVPARMKGTIEEIFVDEGDDVIAGETELFKLDSLKLQEAAMICRQDLTVAECSLVEKKALLERIEADMRQALNEYQRSRKLFKQNAESAQSFERSESRYRQARAQRKHAQALVDLAAEQVNQAQSKLRMAEKDLRDTLVLAPISGKVSQRFQEPGEMGEPGKAVLKLVDPTVVEVSAYLPAQYYSRVFPGATPMRLQVYGELIGEPDITYKSPTIDSRLRTFEIKSLIKNPPDGLVPGAMCEIEVMLDKHRKPGVLTQALQQRGDATVVFVVQNGTAHMVRVQTGLESDGWTEIKGDAVPAGTSVVSMGQFLLNEGTPVAIQKEQS